MAKKLYSVQDMKSMTLSYPFACNHLAEAMRSFEQVCRDERSMLNKYPNDFNLFYMGEYDEGTGSFTLLNQPEFVINASVYVSKTEEKNER